MKIAPLPDLVDGVDAKEENDADDDDDDDEDDDDDDDDEGFASLDGHASNFWHAQSTVLMCFASLTSSLLLDESLESPISIL